MVPHFERCAYVRPLHELNLVGEVDGVALAVQVLEPADVQPHLVEAVDEGCNEKKKENICMT